MVAVKRTLSICSTNRVHFCSPNAAEGRSARARSARRIVRERKERRGGKKGSGSQQDVARLALAIIPSLCTFETQPMKIPRTDGCHASRINCKHLTATWPRASTRARDVAAERREEVQTLKPVVTFYHSTAMTRQPCPRALDSTAPCLSVRGGRMRRVKGNIPLNQVVFLLFSSSCPSLLYLATDVIISVPIAMWVSFLKNTARDS